MSELNFDDLLLFMESKNKQVVKSILEKPGQTSKTIKEDLGQALKRELESLKENGIYLSLGDEERDIILEKLDSIYNLDLTSIDDPKVSRFSKIAKEMVDTYTRKNHDYGDSFGESIEKYGLIAGLVRLSDKWNRLNSLIMGKKEIKVKDESTIDTLTDLACYAIMLRMEIESQV